jgi:hypothetical protein
VHAPVPAASWSAWPSVTPLAGGTPHSCAPAGITSCTSSSADRLQME